MLLNDLHRPLRAEAALVSIPKGRQRLLRQAVNGTRQNADEDTEERVHSERSTLHLDTPHLLVHFGFRPTIDVDDGTAQLFAEFC